MLRRIASEAHIDLRVLFERLAPEHRYYDEGFKQEIKWDVPLSDGYDFAALNDIDLEREIAACDVLWMHGWQTTTLRKALRIAEKLDKPVLMRGENCTLAMPDGAGIRGWIKRFYLNGIFSRCTAFLAIGSLNAAYYNDHGIENGRIFSMPYAVDNDAFRDAAANARENKEALKSRIGIPANAAVVLFSGKLSRRKRPDLLVDAMSRLAQSDPKPVLLFVGDGEMKSQLQEMAPDAVFAGFVNQSELPAYYDMSDVFVLPSEREPWGLAVNEAMACGTPAVVSDEVGCAPDLVDGRSGIVFPTGNAQALSEAIAKCLTDSSQMGAYAAEKILHWGYDADIKGLNQALNEVAVNHGH